MANDETKPVAMVAMMGGDGEVTFEPDDSPELPANIADGVDEDGIVEDLDVETYYKPFMRLLDGDGYLRVIADDDFVDIETRIPHGFLEAAGWRKVVD
jgi:hypothetical protein